MRCDAMHRSCASTGLSPMFRAGAQRAAPAPCANANVTGRCVFCSKLFIRLPVLVSAAMVASARFLTCGGLGRRHRPPTPPIHTHTHLSHPSHPCHYTPYPSPPIRYSHSAFQPHCCQASGHTAAVTRQPHERVATATRCAVRAKACAHCEPDHRVLCERMVPVGRRSTCTRSSFR